MKIAIRNQAIENNYIKIILLIGILILFFSNYATSSDNIPFYGSTKSSEVNVRVGPNIRYPIKWIFVKKGEPFEILARFEQWTKIRDISGEEGWIHNSMLSKVRYAVTIGDSFVKIYKNISLKKAIAEIETQARVRVFKCEKHVCLISVSNVKGWVQKEYLWGINPYEEF